VRCRRIKVLAGRPSLFRQNIRHFKIIRWIADRHGDDPLAGRFAACKLGDPILDVADGAHAPKGRKHRTQALAIHMSVRVDEAWNHRALIEIDDTSCRSSVPRCRFI
jgi:hypothetical protein